MKLTLSENIRMFRKQKKMTQEKLAEALGVTVGAVYKWEAGLSQPELDLLVEMADFFDTSVDVLIGYKMKDNRLDAMLERLNTLCQTMDPAAITEAEKLLGKYPHSFKAVFSCAQIYLVYGAGQHDRDMLYRSQELLERSRILLPQNDDIQIDDSVICGDLSTVWFLLGEKEKCIDLLKKNNATGLFSSQIGLYLSVFMSRPEEAEPFLSDALIGGVAFLLNAIMGYYFSFKARNDWDSAQAVISWGIDLLTGLRKEAQSGLTDKILAESYLLLAYAQAATGRQEDSLSSLNKTKTLMLRFDSKPEYSLRSIRFADQADQAFAYDLLGATASDSIVTLLGILDEPAFTEQWNEVLGND